MVFEKKHLKLYNGAPVAGVSDIVSSGNNTNASGYINKIRMERIKEQQGQKFDIENDPPPED